MLERPEILMVMQEASRDPEAHKREEEQKKQRLEKMKPEELEKLRQDEIQQRKKERAVKMRLNNEAQETIKRETDANYKEAAIMFEDVSKKEEIAKGEISRDLAS